MCLRKQDTFVAKTKLKIHRKHPNTILLPLKPVNSWCTWGWCGSSDRHHNSSTAILAPHGSAAFTNRFRTPIVVRNICIWTRGISVFHLVVCIVSITAMSRSWEYAAIEGCVIFIKGLLFSWFGPKIQSSVLSALHCVICAFQPYIFTIITTSSTKFKWRGLFEV